MTLARSGSERHRRGIKRRQPKRSLVERIKQLFWRLVWWWQGGVLSVELEKENSAVRTDAVIALDRVVLETTLPHDCIKANIVRGGPCIMVKHDDAWEAFIHKTYAEAADKAIEWIRAQGDEIATANTTNLSRKDQKIFDAQRRKLQTAVRIEKRKGGKGGAH